MLDTEPKRTKAKLARAKLAEAMQDILTDYDTLPTQDRHAVDVAIVQCLDVSSKDWRIGMQSLIAALTR